MKRPFSFLRRSAQAPVPEPETPDAGPRPDRPVYVVGDIHGCADLLDPVLNLIDDDIGRISARDPHLVFVGDYIDHGPGSAEVLARMQALDEEFPDHVTCLMGNHERMLLDFLSDPAHRGARWLRAGGAATMASYGLDDPSAAEAPTPAMYEAAARALAAALTPDLAAWVAALPLSWRSGNLWVVHAAADPMHAMEAQSARVLLWGHPEFGMEARADGAWVAHGHTEVDAPLFDAGRINTDTAAWRSGCLTACAIRPDGSHRFLTARR
ncbi:serine/threonine protein phosphatase [Rhodobacterales bacterium HKCCE2091]|nr:serine/threonine protein phosphatase [Rhodobacterales bacterium HKCCE2091]